MMTAQLTAFVVPLTVAQMLTVLAALEDDQMETLLTGLRAGQRLKMLLVRKADQRLMVLLVRKVDQMLTGLRRQLVAEQMLLVAKKARHQEHRQQTQDFQMQNLLQVEKVGQSLHLQLKAARTQILLRSRMVGQTLNSDPERMVGQTHHFGLTATADQRHHHLYPQTMVVRRPLLLVHLVQGSKAAQKHCPCLSLFVKAGQKLNFGPVASVVQMWKIGQALRVGQTH
jgi:hypothetical protein